MEKKLVWVSSSKKDFDKFPDEVRETSTFALLKAQLGGKAISATPLKGFGGETILEIIEDDDEGGTYRKVYTVKFPEVVFVLHAFKKKSKSGIATPRQEIDLVERRLKQADKIYTEDFK